MFSYIVLSKHKIGLKKNIEYLLRSPHKDILAMNMFSILAMNMFSG